MSRSRQHFIQNGVHFWARMLPLIAMLSCIIIIFIGLVARPYHGMASELTLKPWFSRIELLLVLSMLPLFSFSFYRILGSGILGFIIFKSVISSNYSFNFSFMLLLSSVTILTLGAHLLPWFSTSPRKTPNDQSLRFVHWILPLVGIGSSVFAIFNCDRILSFWNKVLGLQIGENTILFANILIACLWGFALIPKFRKPLFFVAGFATFLITQAIHPLLTVVACSILIAALCTFLFGPEPRLHPNFTSV